MARNMRTPITGGKAYGARDMKILPQRRTSGAPAEPICAHETPSRRAKSWPKITDVLPKSLHREIARVHRLAQEAGLFLEDRDLLGCPRCGLLEDVGCYGVLMTYPAGQRPLDSGLRFAKDRRGRYVCPNCGAVARTDREEKKTT
jgi:hypothetical protein